MNIFLLNGPPRSGKDATGKLLAQMLPDTCVLKFAEPVKMVAHTAMRMLRGEGVVPLSEAFDFCKDAPNPYFFDKTPREVYIATSEAYCKPLFGENIFGQLLATKIKKKKEEGITNFIITDAGFAGESKVLNEQFGDQIFVLNLNRHGTSFVNDSRGRLPVSNWQEYEIHNNGTHGELRVRVAEILSNIESYKDGSHE